MTVEIRVTRSISKKVRRRAPRTYREYVLRRGLRRLGSGQPWADLVYGWGNENWSALSEYLEAVASYCRSTGGPILECGSGLTTLVLASLGAEVYTLEHDPVWCQRVRAKLTDFGLSAHVMASPLRSYGAFDWYDVDIATMPAFSLVVCDGPPGKKTRGGRYGLLPVMREHLADGCTILLDDANRPGEREMLGAWAQSLASVQIYGRAEAYAVAIFDSHAAHPSRRSERLDD